MKKLVTFISIVGLFVLSTSSMAGNTPQVSQKCYEACFNKCMSKTIATPGSSSICQRQCFRYCDGK